jgi:hypothetical protein
MRACHFYKGRTVQKLRLGNGCRRLTVSPFTRLRQTRRTDGGVGGFADRRLWRGAGLIAPDQPPAARYLNQFVGMGWGHICPRFFYRSIRFRRDR